jgi:predicted ATPase
LWRVSLSRQDGDVTVTAESLPTGVVTFLLTDIEGSTQAWQAAPADMTALVSRHYEILETGIAEHGGRRPQEQGEGDSVVAVFTDAASALAAAVDTQLTLRRDLPGLPVRMALHTGEAMLRDENNYVGLTIIRCARIRGCGHGGQILLSDDAAGEVRPGLPASVGVVELGLYGLRGLDGRERIWQITHPELPATFPPLKAGASAAGNMPTPISSFVGRRAELAAVSRSLTANRLVTLTGDAGIGKSRLAHAAADAAANSMPGGVWWVGLSDVGVDDVEVVARTIMRACALAGNDVEPLDVISDHFRGVAESLLIVDGYERAPIATASIVEQLLARCPDARVLATGREPLRIPGEAVHSVPALAVPADDFDGGIVDLLHVDAARLFLGRVVDPEIADDRNALHIAGICRDLRGVPLAIELAAAQSAATPLAELAASLGTLAATGTATLAVTLTSSIAWTYQLLRPAEQTALRQLAVFRGEFEIDAATSVVAGPGLDAAATTAAVATLLEQNLLTFDEAAERLVMPPAIRAFARDRLMESDDLAGATARHGAWFAEVAERFGDAGSSLPASLLAPDDADVLAALEASMSSADPSVAYRILIALGGQWRHLDHGDVGERAAAWLCTRTPSDGEQRWAAAVARHCSDQADDRDAEIHAFAEEARAIAEMVGDMVSVELVDRSQRGGDDTTVGTVLGDMATG